VEDLQRMMRDAAEILSRLRAICHAIHEELFMCNVHQSEVEKLLTSDVPEIVLQDLDNLYSHIRQRQVDAVDGRDPRRQNQSFPSYANEVQCTLQAFGQAASRAIQKHFRKVRKHFNQALAQNNLIRRHLCVVPLELLDLRPLTLENKLEQGDGNGDGTVTSQSTEQSQLSTQVDAVFSSLRAMASFPQMPDLPLDSAFSTEYAEMKEAASAVVSAISSVNDVKHYPSERYAQRLFTTRAGWPGE